MVGEAELLEVFRLAELVGDADIAVVVGDRLAGRWVATSRFRDADQVTRVRWRCRPAWTP